MLKIVYKIKIKGKIMKIFSETGGVRDFHYSVGCVRAARIENPEGYFFSQEY
jgi:hypothetical protein